MMDVCLLGTGGMMPLPQRWLTSFLVRFNGRMLLIDCGEGTQIPLKKCGWGFKAIDGVLFTHYHADHIAGLPGLLLTLGNSGREEPLLLMGPPGIKTVVEGLTVICPQLPYTIELLELPDTENSEIGLGELVVRSIPGDHWMPCLSYSIELKRQGRFDPGRAKNLGIPVEYWKRLQKGETIAFGESLMQPERVLGKPRKGIKVSYCTDTRPFDGLAEFVKDSDLFVCEGMYGSDGDLNKARQKKHMLFSEAGRLARQGCVKELWLTHYSPSLEDPGEYLEYAKGIFDNVLPGKDLMSKTLSFKEENEDFIP